MTATEVLSGTCAAERRRAAAAERQRRRRERRACGLRVVPVELSPEAEASGRALGVIVDDPQETAALMGDLVERLLVQAAFEEM